MNKQLWNLNMSELEGLYTKASHDLEQRLLDGASWEEVSDQRKQVGELLTMMYKKLNPAQFGNPAEKASRKDDSHR